MTGWSTIWSEVGGEKLVEREEIIEQENTRTRTSTYTLITIWLQINQKLL